MKKPQNTNTDNTMAKWKSPKTQSLFFLSFSFGHCVICICVFGLFHLAIVLSVFVFLGFFIWPSRYLYLCFWAFSFGHCVICICVLGLFHLAIVLSVFVFLGFFIWPSCYLYLCFWAFSFGHRVICICVFGLEKAQKHKYR
jgi:hypothetical protein